MTALHSFAAFSRALEQAEIPLDAEVTHKITRRIERITRERAEAVAAARRREVTRKATAEAEAAARKVAEERETAEAAAAERNLSANADVLASEPMTVGLAIAHIRSCPSLTGWGRTVPFTQRGKFLADRLQLVLTQLVALEKRPLAGWVHVHIYGTADKAGVVFEWFDLPHGLDHAAQTALLERVGTKTVAKMMGQTPPADPKASKVDLSDRSLRRNVRIVHIRDA